MRHISYERVRYDLLVKLTDLISVAFQGEKHEGFNVLYHNMKSGSLAAKELTDYFRERAKLEEENAKTHQVIFRCYSYTEYETE